MTIKKLWAWIGPALLSAVLAGCGGTTDDGTTTHIRLLNASPDLGAVNLYTDSDQRASNVAVDTVSGYAEFDPDTYTVKLTSSIGITLASVSQELDKNSRYTAVAWGRSGAASLTILTEADSDTDGVNSGWGRLRVFNGAGNEAGSLDVYLLPNSTGATPDVSTSTPAIAGTTTTVTSYSDLLAGTYRLIVTAAGEPSDVRLDLPSFTLGNQQLLTLVLEPSASGVLVHALILAHQGGLAVAKNQSARVRVVASVTAAGKVTAGANGTVLGTSLVSPQIGGYTLVPAGEASIAVTVNDVGVAADSSVTSFVAGSDYTLLVAGAAGSAVEKTIFDDNRLPTNSTKAKIRLIDGFVTGGAANLTVTSTAAGTVTTPPDAAAYVQITPSTSANLTVTSANSGTLFTTLTSSGSTSNTTITAAGVYSVIVLDGGTDGKALGQLFQER